MAAWAELLGHQRAGVEPLGFTPESPTVQRVPRVLARQADLG